MYTIFMRKIEIAPRTIIFTTFFLLGLYLLWFVRDLLYSLFIAFILMSALKPIVNLMRRAGVGRTLAVVFVYLVFVCIFGLILFLIVPPIINESANLFVSLPEILERLLPGASRYVQIDNLINYIPSITNNAFAVVSSIFNNVFFILQILFFGFYLLMEEQVIKSFLVRFCTEEQAHSISQIFSRAEKRMSSWFWGEITLMTIIGVCTYIGYGIVGIKFLLPLAILAGLLEAVPNLGPILAVIPAAIIGFSQSYIVGVSAIGLAFVIQQLEENLIVPLIMRKATGINPIITLIALVVGGQIGGGVGVLIAIPTYLFIETVVIELMHDRKAFQAVMPTTK